MRVEYVKPFAQATYDVLKEVLEVPITRGKLALKKSPVSINGVAVILGLTGGVEGRVIFDLSEESAIKISGAMNYEEFDTFHDLARSTISELGNIIAGKAVTLLNDSGFHFNITPPILLHGKDMKTTDGNMDTVVIPLNSEYGEFNVNIALKEK